MRGCWCWLTRQRRARNFFVKVNGDTASRLTTGTVVDAGPRRIDDIFFCLPQMRQQAGRPLKIDNGTFAPRRGCFVCINCTFLSHRVVTVRSWLRAWDVECLTDWELLLTTMMSVCQPTLLLSLPVLPLSLPTLLLSRRVWLAFSTGHGLCPVPRSRRTGLEQVGYTCLGGVDFGERSHVPQLVTIHGIWAAFWELKDGDTAVA